MEDIILYASLSLIFLVIAYKLRRSKTSQTNLPPAPPSLPLLGHLHLLKSTTPQRCFQKISQKYGPVFTFNLGSKRVVIVSSWPAAEECFTKNDVVLANRPPNTLKGKYLNYGHTTVTSASYGDHWRKLRRIGAIEIFSTHRINAFLNIREDETRRLLRKLSHGSSRDFFKVEMKSMLSDLTFNVIMRMVAGKRYYGDDAPTDKEEAREFKQLIEERFSAGGVGNAENYVPVLRWVTGGRFEKKVKVLGERTDKFLQGLVDEHRNKDRGQEDVTNGTMIDHLLSLQETQPQDYSDVTIKGLVLIMLLAGTDTSAVTLEWAMSNLVNHPYILDKVREELDTQVGRQRLIEETDLPQLHYLHNVISETLRLFPSAPLLLPHYTSGDCTIGGYDVSRDTMVLINAWAIHRDPTVWEDPESFKPERFDGGEGEKEAHHRLLSFGLGRRACPGAGLAQCIVGLTLGALIQCFDWKRVSEELVDLGEGTGTTMPKAVPLEVMCKARDIMDNVLAGDD